MEPELPQEENSELFEHYRFEADKGQGPERLDRFVMLRIEGASRTRVQTAIENGNVLVNGKPGKSSYKIKPLDLVQVVFPQPPREIELIPQNIPIEILFEDEDLVIVSKAAGMVVHPGYGNYTGTLINALIYHFQHLPVSRTGPEGEIRPGLVHRIDKNTSGLLVIAKNEVAMTRLAKVFFDRDLDRRYVALVWGDVKEDEGTVTGHIGRSLRDRKVMQVFPEGDQGKHAVTHYKVLERFGYVTLVECKLETGRTHQIRVHMKYIGHPVFNDTEYGGDQILKGTTFTKYKQFIQNCFGIMPRHALHARTLSFKHPRTKKELHFEAPLPADMTAVIEKWRVYMKNRPE
ncbi:MAG: RluA family pseudouridine synthase [Bacteroidia bacterium]|nr:RluA family pseudouridine synthase [Bacteroidia bacterium]